MRRSKISFYSIESVILIPLDRTFLASSLHSAYPIILTMIDPSSIAYSITKDHLRLPMNLETFDIDDFPTIGSSELDGSSGGSSSVDETSGGTKTKTID